jgi:hypothetical protein
MKLRAVLFLVLLVVLATLLSFHNGSDGQRIGMHPLWEVPVDAQSTITPNLGINIPAIGSTGWAQLYNANWQILENVLTNATTPAGGAPLKLAGMRTTLYIDFDKMATAPGNPATDSCRLFFDAGSGKILALNNAGNSCLATGGTATAPFVTAASNPAGAGVLRLATGDTVCWRNNANTANVCISKDTSDAIHLPNGLTIDAGGLVVTAGGASISGGLNNNNGGITSTGTVTAADLLTASNSNNLTNLSGCQFGPVADTVGTGSAQTIYSCSIPANFVASGQFLRVHVGVNHLSGSASASWTARLNGVNFVNHSTVDAGGIDMRSDLLYNTSTSATAVGQFMTDFNLNPEHSSMTGLNWPASQTLDVRVTVAATDHWSGDGMTVEVIH